MEAYRKRKAEKTAKASYEQRKVEMDLSYEVLFKKNKKAWNYWEAKAPSYRKQCTWWVMSAKKEETRSNRLQILIESSEKEELVPPLKWTVKGK